ncbi:MAG TPA: TonB-dependent receptor [Pyrinomonadaceae bacterium]|nr:TonB-dependent receptor [Pyrinomonadaceae bacterium]
MSSLKPSTLRLLPSTLTTSTAVRFKAEIIMKIFNPLFAISLFVVLALPLLVHAQTGNISGTVSAESRNLSLSGASVRVEGQAIEAVTDESGKYLLQGVRAGTVKVIATYLGLETATQEITVTAGQTATWSPALKLAAQSYAITISAEPEVVGQARALNDQKNSINLVNLVASDQIGNFPDPNAAEAVQRIPGIVVQRDQGEGRYVLIRGTEPRLSAITINGERIGTTENTSRQIPLDTIPADLMDAIEVTKALTPDIEGDSIGGRVNLITKRAPISRQIALTIATGFNTLVRDDIKDYSATYGQSFMDGRLGFIGSANYYENNRGSQDIEPAYTGSLALNSLDLRDYTLTRKRYGGTWDVNYRINSGSEIYLRGLRSEYTDRELRHRFRDLLSNGRLERLLRQRFHDSTQFALMTGGTHNLPRSWSFAWRASYSRAMLTTPYRLESTFRQTGVTFQPNVTGTAIDRENIQANPQNQNLNNFNFIQNAIQDDLGQERNLSGGFDFSAPARLGDHTNGLLKFGFKIRDANRTRDVDSITQTPRSGVTIKLLPNARQNYAPADGFLDGKYVEFGATFPDPIGMQNLSHGGTLNTVISPTGDSGSYRARERVTAGYVMDEIHIGENTTLLGGVRFENTQTRYSAPQYRLGAGGAVLNRTIFEGKNDYLNVLPGIHLRHQLFPDTPLRISFSRTLARPNYSDLAPFVLQDTTGLTISKGNPDLNVTTANNFDASLEHYFQNVGIASAGFFYKHLDNYIFTNTLPETIGSDVYRVTQPVNGEAANLWGLEFTFVRQLDFLPDLLKGFDVYANYTHVHSSAVLPRGDFILPSQASNMGNFSMGYQRKGFSSRISLNYQGQLPLLIGTTVNDDNWLDHRLEVDFSASQRIGKHVKIFIDLLNLANKPYRVYLGIHPDRPIQEERYKIWGITGVKLNF